MKLSGTLTCTRRRALQMLIAVTLLTGDANSHHKFDKQQCARISRKIIKLQSRLRRGYSARQGRRYREQMRELQLTRFRKC